MLESVGRVCREKVSKCMLKCSYWLFVSTERQVFTSYGRKKREDHLNFPHSPGCAIGDWKREFEKNSFQCVHNKNKVWTECIIRVGFSFDLIVFSDFSGPQLISENIFVNRSPCRRYALDRVGEHANLACDEMCLLDFWQSSDFVTIKTRYAIKCWFSVRLNNSNFSFSDSAADKPEVTKILSPRRSNQEPRSYRADSLFHELIFIVNFIVNFMNQV